MKIAHSVKYISSLLLEIYYALLHFFLPHFCLTCSTTNIESTEIICETCWKKLKKAPNNEEIIAELKTKLSGDCCFSGGYSLWQFSPEAQTIIHYLKYRAFGKLALRIGKEMAKQLDENQIPSKSVLLIPIPLHKTRIRERGYNQSTLLCKAIAQELNYCYQDSVLVRNRYTESQTKLTSKQRQKNVENAFAVVKPDKIRNMNIILLDDVITTGATMNACAMELKKNGAKKVFVVSAVKA